jgi:uncharacterized protein RhaS with RHS repeats
MMARNLVFSILTIMAVLASAPAAEARFLQTDPAGTKDDQNLYTYVGNDPTDSVDPTGLDGELNWTAPDRVDYTVKYDVDASGARPRFTPAGLNAAIARNFSGTVTLGNGVVVTVTAHGVAEAKPGSGVNTIKIYRSLTNVTRTGRAETNAIGGNRTTMSASDRANVGAHEVGGHAGGAGDQYKGGVDRSGNILPASVPGPSNIMRDLLGPANAQTLREILGGPTNKNTCAPNVHAANNGC